MLHVVTPQAKSLILRLRKQRKGKCFLKGGGGVQLKPPSTPPIAMVKVMVSYSTMQYIIYMQYILNTSM